MRDVRIVPTAQTHLFWRMGEMKRMRERKPRAPPAKVAQRAQSMGALYGMGIGVCWESWRASGPASYPLQMDVTDNDTEKRVRCVLCKVVFEGSGFAVGRKSRAFGRGIDEHDGGRGQTELRRPASISTCLWREEQSACRLEDRLAVVKVDCREKVGVAVFLWRRCPDLGNLVP